MKMFEIAKNTIVKTFDAYIMIIVLMNFHKKIFQSTVVGIQS